jgi:hypothetical protein
MQPSLSNVENNKRKPNLGSVSGIRSFVQFSPVRVGTDFPSPTLGTRVLSKHFRRVGASADAANAGLPSVWQTMDENVVFSSEGRGRIWGTTAHIK